MTLETIRDIILRADPDCMHYKHRNGTGPYTTWRETRRLSPTSDDQHGYGWAFTVERFTPIEYDEIAAKIEETLREESGIAYSYVVDYEEDTEYIHHIFDCEGV